MNQVAPTIPLDRPTTSTHLQQPWLIIARTIWLLFLIDAAGVAVAALPLIFNFHRNSPVEILTGLTQLGLSVNFYAGYIVVIHSISTIIFIATAIIIFWRKSTDRVAIFISLVLMGFGALPTNPQVINATVSVPLLRLFMASIGVVGWGLLAAFLCIFPDGRFIPRWSVLIAIGGLLFGIAWFLPPDIPFQGSHWTLLGQGLAFLVLGGGVFVAQAYRYRSVSTLLQRKQTKWLIWAIMITVVAQTVMIAVAPSVTTPASQVIVEMVYTLADLSFSLIPLALAFAILRYRLWDIDFLINHSLVYGTLTLLLILVFGGVLYLVSLITQGQQSILTVIVASIAVGGLFQPTRRRLQRAVDNRFYNIRIDYERRSPAPQSLSGDITAIMKHAKFSRYSQIELIGHGGMAEVYKAQTLKRPVAIKLLPATLASDSDFRIRFEREAEIVSRLRHPNIIHMLDYGQLAGIHYMVMEYIEGQDLAQRIKSKGRLALAEVVPLVKDIADALDYAHTQGLVHRDIKPSNIMWDERRNHAVLMDFGIAKMLNRSTIITHSGVIVGTLHYIAPEQIEDGEVDGRADLYSLGVMIYQMLTGELPFKHAHLGALLIAHLTQPPPDPRSYVSDLPPHISKVIARALAKRPNERYQTAGELAQALSS